MYLKKGDSKKDKQDYNSVNLLIEELSSQQLPRRINSIKNMKQIIVALGHDRTVNELLNLIVSEILNDEDEVVSVLIDRLLDISEALGNPAHNIILLPIFEALIQLETAALRDKANDKLEQAISVLDIKRHEDALIKMLRRVDALQFPQTRQTLCRVTCQILNSISAPSQTQLLNFYLKAASDQSSVSRKYAAKYSKDLVQYVKLNENIIMKIIEMLFKDKEEANKIYLIDTLIQLAKYKQQAALQPYLNLISYQFTWRVRYQLIARVRDLASVLEKQHFRTLFLPFYTKYLNDLEAEIRSIACTQLMSVCEFIEPDDIVTKVLPALKSIPQDSQVYVRHALAKTLLLLCPLVGKKHTTQQILPKFLQLLKDQDSQVRVAIFYSVNQITKVLGIQTLSQTTIPALQELSAHKSWRIRCQSLEILMYFGQGLGPDFLVNDKNNKIYFDLFKDKVYAVRRKAIDCLKNLIQMFGAGWFEKNMIPKLIVFQKINTFLQRQTFIFAVQTVANLVSVECLQRTLTPMILTMCSDPVENIRFNSLKVLGCIARLVKDVQAIKRVVKSLKDDKDPDVRFMVAKVQRDLQNR